jgi:hypothetical protein
VKKKACEEGTMATTLTRAEKQANLQKELDAVKEILEILLLFDNETRTRIINAACTFYGFREQQNYDY